MLIQIFYRSLEIRRLEAEGTCGTLVSNFALLIDQVEPVRPAGVCLLGRVVDSVYERRKLDAEVDRAGRGQLGAILICLGVLVNHLLLLVDRQLPAVARVRLLNVDQVEGQFILVLPVELVEGGNLPPEGRSGVAAEDQDYWLVSAER